MKDLNFKVEPSFHQAFKLEAARRKLSMKELLKASFWLWVMFYPPDP